MKNHFRYGYDPWMIGMTIVILIVEALGFFLGEENAYDPFASIPFWLLTLYIIAMIAMFLTACFIKNDAFRNERTFYKSPFALTSIVVLGISLIIGLILKAFFPEGVLFSVVFIPISIGLMAFARKNWISLFSTILFFVVSISTLTFYALPRFIEKKDFFQ